MNNSGSDKHLDRELTKISKLLPSKPQELPKVSDKNPFEKILGEKHAKS
jgi:hypothetical protein